VSEDLNHTAVYSLSVTSYHAPVFVGFPGCLYHPLHWKQMLMSDRGYISRQNWCLTLIQLQVSYTVQSNTVGAEYMRTLYVRMRVLVNSHKQESIILFTALTIYESITEQETSVVQMAGRCKITFNAKNRTRSGKIITATI